MRPTDRVEIEKVKAHEMQKNENKLDNDMRIELWCHFYAWSLPDSW